MTLNSLDVQNKTFNPQFRGFSKHEVDEFLDIVVRDYDEFAQTIKDQERELKALRERPFGECHGRCIDIGFGAVGKQAGCEVEYIVVFRRSFLSLIHI